MSSLHRQLASSAARLALTGADAVGVGAESLKDRDNDLDAMSGVVEQLNNNVVHAVANAKRALDAIAQRKDAQTALRKCELDHAKATHEEAFDKLASAVDEYRKRVRFDETCRPPLRDFEQGYASAAADMRVWVRENMPDLVDVEDALWDSSKQMDDWLRGQDGEFFWREVATANLFVREVEDLIDGTRERAEGGEEQGGKAHN